MELSLGKRADYTVRAVLDLARHHGDGRRKTAEIAAEMQVPPTYLPQLLAVLVRTGIVRSLAGRHGGYELARPPDEISLLEVIEVADGPLISAECVLRGGPCRWEGSCAIHAPWARAQEAFRASLGGTTFAEVAAIDAVLNGSSGAAAPPPPAALP
jgi:Rrf2 family transcriptional regulator, iron-sulfur cluster assembly transcription factor